MRISGLFYSMKQGIINIWRNKLFSTASIATMTACIFLFGLFYAIVANFQSMVRDVEKGVAITVFFDEDASEEQIQAIGQAIKMAPGVLDQNYVSADAAWEEFKNMFYEEGEADEIYGDDNPLDKLASYEVYLQDVSEQQELVKHLESLAGVREVRQSESVANMLTDFNRLVGYVSMGIIMILFAVAIFLISNTVSIGITVRKEEISIMKLIGASDYFVKAPFYVEGIMIGLIGSVLPMLIFYSLYEKMIQFVSDKFSFLSSLMTFLPVNEVFQTLLPAAVALGIGIGFIGSAFTIRKHLRV
ncbi:MAG: ABC transporter permease [Eubacterium sp.]|jgi:cell division transport system permease protein|nr:ABC transporter permease [Eubacterium sp.]